MQGVPFSWPLHCLLLDSPVMESLHATCKVSCICISLNQFTLKLKKATHLCNGLSASDMLAPLAHRNERLEGHIPRLDNNRSYPLALR